MTRQAICGRKGGESPPPRRYGHPHPDWMEIPKSLASGMNRRRPERLMLWLWMTWRDFEESERLDNAGEDPEHGGCASPTPMITAGTGLDIAVVASVLREMAQEGYVQETPAGWKIVCYPVGDE